MLYLLQHGARCESNSWDGERCFYVALSDRIRRHLRQFQAANRARGPLFALTFRAYNNPAAGTDVTFTLGDGTSLHAHVSLLAARSPYMRERFAPGGRWAGKRVVPLPDPRLSGTALQAVFSFLYTERLLCPRSALREVGAVARNLRLRALHRFVTRYIACHSSSSGDGGGDSFGMLAVDLGAPYQVGALPAGVDDDDDGAGDSDEALSLLDSDTAAVGRLGVSKPLLAALARHGLRRDLYRNLFLGKATPGDSGRDTPVVPPRAWDVELSVGLLQGSVDADALLQEEEARLAAAAASDDVVLSIPHDLEIVCHGLVFRAHRWVIEGRSKYFEATLRFAEAHQQLQQQQATNKVSSSTPAFNGGTSSEVPDPTSPHTDPAAARPVTRLRLQEVSPATLAHMLEWVYTDTLRPLPHELLLEALHAADALLLVDGVKPLLVGQAIGLLDAGNVVDLMAAADLYNLHRLAAACARFAALELEAVLAMPDFEALIMRDAEGIVGRQATDSVPMLDDIKTEIRSLYGLSAADIVRAAASGQGHSSAAPASRSSGGDELAAKRAELSRRLGLLESFASRLGLRCFSADEAAYSGRVWGGELGSDSVGGGSGGHGAAAQGIHLASSAAGGGIPLNIPGQGVRLVSAGAGHGAGAAGEGGEALSGELFRAIKGFAFWGIESTCTTTGANGAAALEGGDPDEHHDHADDDDHER